MVLSSRVLLLVGVVLLFDSRFPGAEGLAVPVTRPSDPAASPDSISGAILPGIPTPTPQAGGSSLTSSIVDDGGSSAAPSILQPSKIPPSSTGEGTSVTASIVKPSQQTAPASVIANYTSTSPARPTAVHSASSTSSAGTVPMDVQQVIGQVVILIVVLIVFYVFLITIHKFRRPTPAPSRGIPARPVATPAAVRALPRTDSMATAVEMQSTQHGVRGSWPRPSSMHAIAQRSDSTLVDRPPAPSAASGHVVINTVVYPLPWLNAEHALTQASGANAGAIPEAVVYSEEPEEVEGSTL